MQYKMCNTACHMAKIILKCAQLLIRNKCAMLHDYSHTTLCSANNVQQKDYNHGS